jgi:hypothetical protein
VWAVGGVGRNHQPLANARSGSTPPLVAYGDHATVQVSDYLWTDTLTGTSVSAVVASSIAAVVWHLRPELTAPQVMALLQASGQDLGRRAELYRAQSLDDDPVLSHARSQSFRTATPLAQAPNVHLLLFAPALSLASSPPSLKNQMAAQTGMAGLSCADARVDTSSSCGSGKLWICPGTATGPTGCPAKTLPSIAAVSWVLPQPDQDPCPSCTLSSGQPPCPTCRPGTGPGPDQGLQIGPQLDLQIPSNWQGGCVSEVLLEVETPGSTGSQMVWIQPPGGQLCAGDWLRVTDLPNLPSTGTASISFALADHPYSARSPVYLGWWP